MEIFINEDTKAPRKLSSFVYAFWWLESHVLMWLDEAQPNDHRQKKKQSKSCPDTFVPVTVELHTLKVE